MLPKPGYCFAFSMHLCTMEPVETRATIESQKHTGAILLSGPMSSVNAGCLAPKPSAGQQGHKGHGSLRLSCLTAGFGTVPS